MSIHLLLQAALVAAACLSPLTAQCRGGGGGPGPQPIDPPPMYRGPGDISVAPQPSAPSAPMPGSPNAPRPQTPNGPLQLPASPTAGARTASPRGAPITYTHRRNALDRLRVDWIYPNLQPVRPEGDTAARPRSLALPGAEMLALLADTDPRPILILRECQHCQGSEAALIDAERSNEKTMLLARWFRCIRLDDSVRHETHPCRLLFEEYGMPHLLLWSPHAERAEPLDGAQAQSKLWSAMRRVLRQSYTKDPDAAVSEMFKILAAFDHLDSMESEISARLQAALDEVTSTSARAQELEADLVKVREKRDALIVRERSVMDLGLRPRPADASR